MQSLIKKGPMLYFATISFETSYHGAHLQVSVQVEVRLSTDKTGRYSCTGLESRKPAAFDICVVSPLNSNVLSAVGATAGAASEAAELRKHTANDAKCAELGWVSHPSCGGVFRGMGQGGSTLFISTWVSPCYPQLLWHL